MTLPTSEAATLFMDFTVLVILNREVQVYRYGLILSHACATQNARWAARHTTPHATVWTSLSLCLALPSVQAPPELCVDRW